MPLSDQLEGRFGRATVALITITEQEFDGVRSSFGLSHELARCPYATDTESSDGNYPLVLRRAPGQTNLIAAEVTSSILEDFRPSYLIVIGTAGGHSGREQLKLGDLVIADYIDYSAYWKLNGGKFRERRHPFDHPSLHLREHYAERLRRNPHEWIDQVTVPCPNGSTPRALTGGVVAGEMLLGDSKNKEQQRILKRYEKALAFEMESFGIARTVYRFRSSVHYNPQFLIVRGISDLVDTSPEENNEARKLWTPYAINVAAAFAKVLVKRLLKQT